MDLAERTYVERPRSLFYVNGYDCGLSARFVYGEKGVNGRLSFYFGITIFLRPSVDSVHDLQEARRTSEWMGTATGGDASEERWAERQRGREEEEGRENQRRRRRRRAAWKWIRGKNTSLSPSLPPPSRVSSRYCRSRSRRHRHLCHRRGWSDRQTDRRR